MIRFFASALCLTLGLAAFGEAKASTMEFEGYDRTFEMYVPATTPRPLPVVLILHGGRGTAAQMRRYTDFDSLAAKEGILAVYPQGLNGHWNDGRPELGNNNLSHQASEANDVDFLLALVDNLVSHGLADPKRVYVTGISNGGMMAIRLACEHPGRIAGIAVVAANQPVEADCEPQTPVPALFFHGTNDRFVPYAGGDILQWANVDRGKVLSAAETVATWRKINGCTGEARKQRLVDGSRKGSLPIDKVTFEPCDGAPVERVIIRGGGHAWPGARQAPAVDEILGPAGTDLIANTEIWDFFKAQPTR
ncbi:alpha/beta hydrolase family esterase [Telmatospirillum siberiense]|nr:PHB depolymerase family esterase [Telmatospirillum siberiense]